TPHRVPRRVARPALRLRGRRRPGPVGDRLRARPCARVLRRGGHDRHAAGPASRRSVALRAGPRATHARVDRRHRGDRTTGARGARAPRLRRAAQGSVARLRAGHDPRLRARPRRAGDGRARVLRVRPGRSGPRRAVRRGAQARAAPGRARRDAHPPRERGSGAPGAGHRRPRLSRHGYGRRAGPGRGRRARRAARLAMVLSGDRRAVGTLQSALAGKGPGRRNAEVAAGLLALVAETRDSELLLERATAAPTRALVTAVGWAGAPTSVPSLLGLLEHADDAVVLAAAYAHGVI